MTILLVALLAGCVWAEQSGNPLFERLGLDTQASELQAGGNMEGKETRFGIVNSALWATVTTAASNGSVNAMHDSFTPLGGLVPMWLMQLGEVVFGGVGSGLVRDAGVRAGGGVRRRADDRAYPRIPRQENRGIRDENGGGGDPHPAVDGAAGYGTGGDAGCRPCRDCQSGGARLFGSAVCIFVRREQ